MAEKSLKEKSGFFFPYLCSKGFQKSPSSSSPSDALSVTVSDQKKPGGWKAMPFILGNETFERFATIGLLSNFMVFDEGYNMEQVSASNVIYIWSGVTNFAPLIGAFISDAYVGRFLTIGVSSVASFLGMLTITLTAWIPDLQPPKCLPEQKLLGHCIGPSMGQMGVLITGLGLLSIGTGGIRPCSIPFGIDQFDPTTEEGAKGISSFFNCWVLGLGIPTILMASSIVLFLVGTRIYVHVKPQGSIFSNIAQVFFAAYKKRHLRLPAEGQECGVYYDPPVKDYVLSKLPLTYQFRFLNKAAIVTEDDIEPDGSFNRWRLCSVQDVEEVKCIIRIIPVWASGIISFTAMGQQGTFTLSQALKMDRHLGPKFEIPAGSMGVISMITIGIYLPLYDRVIAPALQKITKPMIAAGVFEQKRRNSAIMHPDAPPISVFWLSPQLVLMGFCEAFNILGQIEFFNKQFPDHMKSIANSLLFVPLAVRAT
ncbi:Protein NRT1/ PTR FAMILY 2.13 [Hibiscus syriacus]|uniref:Protein NRT1/ PTR FAMILY 2.13 n=1 Tax=Hibiscus syriacus TaxID=106335 RepID=A0A6A2ZXM7_HIBSY|nr:Protein NRT1/ PTR FAMILY 2.13 [Hibiscus syriacus]